MNHQFLLQKFNQIIDLYENTDTSKNLTIKIKAERPISYTFLSKQKLDSTNTGDIPMASGIEFQKVISAAQRYLLVRSNGDPTVLNISKSITSNVAELFFGKTIGQNISDAFFYLFFAIGLLLALAFIGFCFLPDPRLFMMHKFGDSKKFQGSPMTELFRGLKEPGITNKITHGIANPVGSLLRNSGLYAKKFIPQFIETEYSQHFNVPDVKA